MTRKAFWFMLPILFLGVILAGCASSSQVSEIIPTQTLAPQEPVKVATPTSNPLNRQLFQHPLRRPGIH